MSVVNLWDAKTHLNITTDQYDAELQSVVNSAESAVAQIVGPLAPVSVTRRVRGNVTRLLFPVLPVISVTTLTPVGGTPLDATNLTVDASGSIEFIYGGVFIATWYDVTCQVGLAAVDDGLLLAIKEKIRDLWGTQRGTTIRRPVSESASGAYPSQFDDLIRPYRMPGFA